MYHFIRACYVIQNVCVNDYLIVSPEYKEQIIIEPGNDDNDDEDREDEEDEDGRVLKSHIATAQSN